MTNRSMLCQKNMSVYAKKIPSTTDGLYVYDALVSDLHYIYGTK
jgi:hypothetical protein